MNTELPPLSPASLFRSVAFVLLFVAAASPDRVFWRILAVAALLALLSISHEMRAAGIPSDTERLT